MKRTRHLLLALCAVALLGTACARAAAVAEPDAKKPVIQIALLLDTSNSMDGLIDQAKRQLWKVVNEFIAAKRAGQKPEFQVALYEYGKQTLSAESGFIRQICPLTTDLDKVSQELFALRTNGGEEYCGWAIKNAVNDLAWSAGPKDLKTIFIAGNEPFSQGSVDYRVSCREAIAKGIMVNTIFCGNAQQGVQTGWKDGATLADGSYMNIDQNLAVAHVDAPQDKAILELNQKLSGTYIAYGRDGEAKKENQAVQDRNSEQAGQGSLRAQTKASGLYRNESWDLVDAAKDEKFKLADVKAEELPEEMRRLSAEERKAYVEAKAQERAKIQKQIAELSAEREKFVAEELKKRGEDKNGTLGQAMIEAARKQAEKLEFKFE
ncbi:MAG: VWA domain-containing protein [Planctomycetota bacterium]|nr:VWA domain-containing protein [Planctomycetota bacterium]